MEKSSISPPRPLPSATASFQVPLLSVSSAFYSLFSMALEAGMTLELQLFHFILPLQWLNFHPNSLWPSSIL